MPKPILTDLEILRHAETLVKEGRDTERALRAACGGGDNNRLSRLLRTARERVRRADASVNGADSEQADDLPALIADALSMVADTIRVQIREISFHEAERARTIETALREECAERMEAASAALEHEIGVREQMEVLAAERGAELDRLNAEVARTADQLARKDELIEKLSARLAAERDDGERLATRLREDLHAADSARIQAELAAATADAQLREAREVISATRLELAEAQKALIAAREELSALRAASKGEQDHDARLTRMEALLQSAHEMRQTPARRKSPQS